MPKNNLYRKITIAVLPAVMLSTPLTGFAQTGTASNTITVETENQTDTEENKQTETNTAQAVSTLNTYYVVRVGGKLSDIKLPDGYEWNLADGQSADTILNEPGVFDYEIKKFPGSSDNNSGSSETEESEQNPGGSGSENETADTAGTEDATEASDGADTNEDDGWTFQNSDEETSDTGTAEKNTNAETEPSSASETESVPVKVSVIPEDIELPEEVIAQKTDGSRIVTGSLLGTISLPNGFRWLYPASSADVPGDMQYPAMCTCKYTGENGIQKTVILYVPVTVNAVLPSKSIEWREDLSVKDVEALTGIDGKWTVDEESVSDVSKSIGEIGSRYVKLSAVESDDNEYRDCKNVEIEINTVKAETVPVTATYTVQVTEGDKPDASQLPKADNGTFEWESDDEGNSMTAEGYVFTLPSGSGQESVRDCTAVFYPTDSEHYKESRYTITVTIHAKKIDVVNPTDTDDKKQDDVNNTSTKTNTNTGTNGAGSNNTDYNQIQTEPVVVEQETGGSKTDNEDEDSQNQQNSTVSGDEEKTSVSNYTSPSETKTETVTPSTSSGSGNSTTKSPVVSYGWGVSSTTSSPSSTRTTTAASSLLNRSNSDLNSSGTSSEESGTSTGETSNKKTGVYAVSKDVEDSDITLEDTTDERSKLATVAAADVPDETTKEDSVKERPETSHDEDTDDGSTESESFPESESDEVGGDDDDTTASDSEDIETSSKKKSKTDTETNKSSPAGVIVVIAVAAVAVVGVLIKKGKITLPFLNRDDD